MPRRVSVISIGTFDGVHVGHVELLRRARVAADAAGGKVVALTFDPHPNTLLRPGSVPERLTTFERKADLLRAGGADEVVRLEPTLERMSLLAEEFLAPLITRYRPVAFVEGSDFRFGKKRRGNNQMLAEYGEKLGFEVHVVEAVEVALGDQHVVKASSTLVRWLLEHGRVQDAARVLGRDYQLSGKVVRGDRRGRILGFPTANIATTCAVPQAGVYAASARLPDGREFPAAVSVGPRPTFDAPEPRVEAFLILPEPAPRGEPIRGLPEYGWSLTLRFRRYLREQLKFDSAAELIEQMARDCERAIQHLDAAGDAAENGVTLCR